MAVPIKRELWGRVFATPSAIVDDHIRLCSETSLKTLLIILRSEETLTPHQIADKLGGRIAASDIDDALRYWIDAGVLEKQEERDASNVENLVDRALKRHRVKDTPSEDDRDFKVIGKSRMRLSTPEINRMAKNDPNVAFILQESQSVLGKELTPVATDTIVSLYGFYGMPPDIVLMLLQHCVSMGRSSMRHVEKEAASWLEKGIDTHEKAERELISATKRASFEGIIKKAFGIWDRELISKEKKFLQTWEEEYKFDIEIIKIAYERCIELKGTLSFAYINGILKKWHDRGVSSAESAQRETHEGSRETNNNPNKRQASYEISELEQLIRNRKT